MSAAKDCARRKAEPPLPPAAIFEEIRLYYSTMTLYALSAENGNRRAVRRLLDEYDARRVTFERAMKEIRLAIAPARPGDVIDLMEAAKKQVARRRIVGKTEITIRGEE